MKEGKKTQLSCLRYQMFIHLAMVLIKKENYLLLQVEELASTTKTSQKKLTRNTLTALFQEILPNEGT